MVGHEDVGIEPGVALPFRLAQAIQEDVVIFFCEEGGLPIVPTLDDVMRIRRDGQTRQPGRAWEAPATTEALSLPRDRPVVNEIVL